MSGRYRPFGPLRGIVHSTIFLISLIQAAQAHPITFAFEGLVDLVDDSHLGFYPELVDSGSPFSGTFTFESDTPPTTSNPSESNYFGAVLSIDAQVGALIVSESPPADNRIDVVNDVHPNPYAPPKWDSYAMVATVSLFGHPTSMGIAFTDYEGRTLTSTTLPLTPPVFGDIRFGLQMLDGGSGIGGLLTSFTLVPEPGGLAMIILGASAALARRRRRACAALLVAGFCGIFATPTAQGHPITFAFEGVVDGVYDSHLGFYPELVDFGSPFSGTFTFESDTPASPVNQWRVEYLSAVLAIEAHVGGLTVSENPPTASKIEVLNDLHPNPYADPKNDSYFMDATVQLYGHPAHFEIGFIDYEGQTLNSTALPLVPPVFDDIDFAFQMLDGGSGVEGALTSLTLVPEPGGFIMVTVSATLALARRRRSAQR